MHDGITEIHTRHLLGNQRARARYTQTICLITLKFSRCLKYFPCDVTRRENERACARIGMWISVSVNDTRRHSQTNFQRAPWVWENSHRNRLRENGEILMRIQFLRIVTVNSEVKWIDFLYPEVFHWCSKNLLKFPRGDQSNHFFL